MADGIKLLEAYIQLSTKGYQAVLAQLQTLKQLTAELKGSVVLDVDATEATRTVKSLRASIVDTVKAARQSKGPRDILGISASSAARQAKDSIKDLRNALRDSGISSEVRKSLGIDTQISGYQRVITVMQEQIRLQRAVGNASLASKTINQLQQWSVAQRAVNNQLLTSAKLTQDMLDAENRAANDKKRNVQESVKAYNALARQDRASIQLARDTIVTKGRLTEAESRHLRAQMKTVDGTIKANALISAEMKRQAAREAADVARRIRDAQRAADATARAAKQRQRDIESSEAAISSLGSGILGRSASSLSRISQALGVIAKTPVDAGGIVGFIANLTRSSSTVVSAIGRVGSALSAIAIPIGLLVSGFTLLFNVIGTAVGAIVSIAGTIASVITSAVGMVANITRSVVGFAASVTNLTVNALRPAVTALLDFVFPLRGIASLILDIKRRLGPFIASFVAFRGIGVIASEVSEFEQNLLRAATLTGDVGQSLTAVYGAMSAAAADVAAKTRFSTKEVGLSLLELTKAGLDARSAIELLKPTLSLATLANTNAASATNIFTRTMTGFSIATGEAKRVLDGLVSATRQSPIELEETGTALSRVSASSRLFGIGLEETLAILVKFGDVGVRGERAATALSRGFERLVQPSKDVQQAIDDVLKKQNKNIFSFFKDDGTLKEGRKSLLELVDAFSLAIKQGDLNNSSRTKIFGARGREFVNLFTDTIDQRTGQLITARQKLESILLQIQKDQQAGISELAIEFESGSFNALAERLQSKFGQIGEAFKSLFGGQIRQTLIGVNYELEVFIIKLGEFKSVQRIAAAVGARFEAMRNALAPLIGFIVRMNVALATGILLTINELITRFSGPFLQGLKKAIDAVMEFAGLGNSSAFDSWENTLAFLQQLTRQFGTVFNTVVESIRLAALKGAAYLLQGFTAAFVGLQTAVSSVSGSIGSSISKAIELAIKFAVGSISILTGPLVNASALIGVSIAKGVIVGFRETFSAIFGSAGKGILNTIAPGLGETLFGQLGGAGIDKAIDPLIEQFSAATAASASVAGTEMVSRMQDAFKQFDLETSIDVSAFAEKIEQAMVDAGFALDEIIQLSVDRLERLKGQLLPPETGGTSVSEAGTAKLADALVEATKLLNSAAEIQKGINSEESKKYLQEILGTNKSYQSESLKLQKAMIQAIEEGGGLQ